MNAAKNPRSQKPMPEKVKCWMQDHPLFAFFFLAYLISWILSIPFILSEWGILPEGIRYTFAIKSFGPFLAAWIMARILPGKDGAQSFWRQFRQGKAGWLWYVLILFGFPVLIVSGIAIQPGMLAGFDGIPPQLPVTYLVSFLSVAIGGGPLGEEPGWRGFALPRLQQRRGPLWGTVLLSVLWAGWHLPDFLTSAQGGGPGTGLSDFVVNFPIFLLLITALTILLTWLFNHTGGSVVFAILAHASINTPQLALVPLFPAVTTTTLNIAALIGFGIPALLLLIGTRGRLGYTKVHRLNTP